MARTTEPVALDLWDMLQKALPDAMRNVNEGAIRESVLREVIQVLTDRLSRYLSEYADKETLDWVRHKMEPGQKVEPGHKVVFNGALLDAKTLKNVLLEQKASSTTINILRAFQRAEEYFRKQESVVDRIAGLYNQINVHTHKHEHLQVSQIRIDGENSYIYYKSRRYTDERHPLRVEMIGANRVLMTMRWGDCVMCFYAMIGSSAGKLKFFEAVFIYNNDKGDTIAGRTIFEKVDEEKFKPRDVGRHFNDLPSLEAVEGASAGQTAASAQPYEELMVRYLRHKSDFIIPQLHGQRPFDFSLANPAEFKPGPYKTTAVHYESAHRQIRGFYDVYFTERFPSVTDFERKHFSTVGKGLLLIYADENRGGVLCCQFKIQKNDTDAVLEYKGYVINQELTSSSYIIMSLYLDPEKNRQLGFALNIMNDKVFIGAHHSMYSAIAKIGAGVLIVVRKEPDREKSDEERYKNCKPKVINPYEYDWKKEEPSRLDAPKESQIVQLLSRRERALVSAPSMEQLMDIRLSIHAGAYKVYAYGKGGVNVSFINMYPNGFAEHFGFSDGRDTAALGKFKIERTIINMEFQDKENDRTGYFVIKVSEIKPEADKTWYVGTFNGVTRNNGELPLASRVFLQYMGLDVYKPMDKNIMGCPHLAFYDKPPFEALPDVIKKLLSHQKRTSQFLDPVDPIADENGLSNLVDY